MSNSIFAFILQNVITPMPRKFNVKEMIFLSFDWMFSKRFLFYLLPHASVSGVDGHTQHEEINLFQFFTIFVQLNAINAVALVP